ncbi:Poly{3-hydroxyalkanoate} synthetase [Geoglobus ahangari]|uniref:Poly(3-hydroxyalkanoate) synthetase n=1 Tax=Geoglobus ahangari TaxID=113653 RepID=A0A0F7ICK0_9EURY|nr:alpha/beta fold hydrolase [Geoglobus ahangari]AKG91008.1 Poly{3-hydroxyalkanoate} synthetase [Geoglobus ahangari]NOY11463.1 alpha/beta fold hydrolase [Archaeoglobi archaeon]
MSEFECLKEVDICPWSCEFDVVDEDWLFKLLHFKPRRKRLLKTPVLIVYAYINRPYILDLHERVSVVRKMLEAGLDVWMVDWGYPKRADKYYRIEDYVDYIDRCVNIIKKKKKVDKVTLHGYCLGATLSTIYSTLHPENVKNLVVQAPPINFHTDNTLAVWARNIDPDKVARAMGNASGDFLNFAFLLVDPIRLTVEKYQALLNRLDDRKFVHDFLYMDHWIFDSPAIPGCVYEEYITRWYHRNEVIEGKFDVNGQKVDLRKITMPTLLLVADRDHITPPECAIPFYEKIPSKDKLMLRVNKGHIGLTVSSSAHRELWDKAIKWIVERSK